MSDEEIEKTLFDLKLGHLSRWTAETMIVGLLETLYLKIKEMERK